MTSNLFYWKTLLILWLITLSSQSQAMMGWGTYSNPFRETACGQALMGSQWYPLHRPLAHQQVSQEMEDAIQWRIQAEKIWKQTFPTYDFTHFLELFLMLYLHNSDDPRIPAADIYWALEPFLSPSVINKMRDSLVAEGWISEPHSLRNSSDKRVKFIAIQNSFVEQMESFLIPLGENIEQTAKTLLVQSFALRKTFSRTFPKFKIKGHFDTFVKIYSFFIKDPNTVMPAQEFQSVFYGKFSASTSYRYMNTLEEAGFIRLTYDDIHKSLLLAQFFPLALGPRMKAWTQSYKSLIENQISSDQ